MEKLNTSIIHHDFSIDLNNIMSINESIDDSTNEDVNDFEDDDIDFGLYF